MKNSVYLGEVPAEEDCMDFTAYPNAAKHECRVLIGQIARQIGPPPLGARLVLKSNPHDYGNYPSVECEYDEENQNAAAYAFYAEECYPAYWDTLSLNRLRELDIPVKQMKREPETFEKFRPVCGST